MNFSKFLFTEEETFLLFKEFLYEALRFLNVDEERYPEISNTLPLGCDDKSRPIYIDYDNNLILISIPFFRSVAAWNPSNNNDGPTMYRATAYKAAYIWRTYLSLGDKRDYSTDVESTVFAQVLNIIKGIPLLPLIPDNRTTLVAKSIVGIDPNDRQPILKMLREEFGMLCQVKTKYDIAERRQKDFIVYTQEENERRSREFRNLYNESLARPTPPKIVEGELGSETNPFENVDVAAEYILKLEQEHLKADRYRQSIDNEQYYYDYERGYFRISWASPNVGYYDLGDVSYPCFVANQLSLQPGSKNLQMPRFTIKPSLRNKKFLFRGQAEFFNPCKPSMFRDKAKTYFVDDVIQINELEILLQQHPLVKLFEQGFMLMNEFIRFKIHYGGLSQHYYNNTPYLDLTSDMDVAKFFAVTTFDMDNDRYVKYNGSKLGVLYYYDLKPGAFSYSEERKYLVESIGKQPFMRSGNQYGFLIDLEKDDDFNSFPEVRYVFFKHNPDITERIFKDSQFGDKYMPQEILRTNWYRRMSDKEARKKVSTKALKLNFEHNPDESHSKIVKKLREKGFSISSKHTPYFTEKELDLYYTNSIKIWEDFCSDIHFYGPEGLLLKKHLHNLPNDPRYRWAFYKDANQG